MTDHAHEYDDHDVHREEGMSADEREADVEMNGEEPF